MKNMFKVIFKVLASFLVFVGVLSVIIQLMPQTREINAFDEKFKTIEIGDAEQRAIEILGKPDDKKEKFHLGQFKHFEDVYDKAEQTNSDYYLIWNKGIDYVFTIGIKNGSVTIRESGGT